MSMPSIDRQEGRRIAAEIAEASARTTTDDPVERQRNDLAVGFRIFAQHGFDFGVAGHISVRHAEDPDLFWVNPIAQPFGLMQIDDLHLVDHAGRVIQGNATINHSAFLIHAAIHERMPHVASVAHAHSTNGVAWSSLGRLLRPINQNACVFYEDHLLYDEYFGPVLAGSEAESIAQALANHGGKAAILRNHGIMTLGESVGEAVWWFVAMDRACQVELLALASGVDAVEVPHEVAVDAREVSGTPAAAEMAFRTLARSVMSDLRSGGVPL